MVVEKKKTIKVKKPLAKKVVKAKKPLVKKAVKVEKPLAKKTTKAKEYFEGIGRRKTSVARVRLVSGKEKSFLVNEKPLEGYFSLKELQKTALAPFDLVEKTFNVSAKVSGGGINSQAEAIRHGVARALVLIDPELRKRLKNAGYLKRDPRMKERKKFGLLKARRAPQWSKR